MIPLLNIIIFSLIIPCNGIDGMNSKKNPIIPSTIPSSHHPRFKAQPFVALGPRADSHLLGLGERRGAGEAAAVAAATQWKFRGDWHLGSGKSLGKMMGNGGFHRKLKGNLCGKWRSWFEWENHLGSFWHDFRTPLSLFRGGPHRIEIYRMI